MTIGPQYSESARRGYPHSGILEGVQGRIVQVSLGPGGVPNRAVPEALVTKAGLAGDSFRHPSIHGGFRQAVLIVTSEGIEELKERGYALYPGALGENLTTEGIPRQGIRPGQTWRVGADVILEITKRRAPCKTLQVYGPSIQNDIFDAQMKANDESSPVWGLSGLYARVIEGGVVRPGDPIFLIGQDV